MIGLLRKNGIESLGSSGWGGRRERRPPHYSTYGNNLRLVPCLR